MNSESRTTTDHETVRAWAEERGGAPASVKDTGEGSDAGVLRIVFDSNQESLDRISWDEFFEKFEKEQLAFLYQERTRDGAVSRFFKLISR